MMELTKEAIEKIEQLTRDTQEIIDIGGEKFCAGQLKEIIPYQAFADPIELYSLTGLVDYLKSDEAEHDIGSENSVIIHVDGPRLVEVISMLNGKQRKRETLARVCINDRFTKFNFGEWFSHQAFMISLMSHFKDCPNKAALLKLLGTITDENVTTSEDDGVTQKITCRVGLILNKEQEIPNPMELTPWRTFREVDQPTSPFLFRLRKDQRGRDFPECALFPCDGGEWRLNAVANIVAYLSQALPNQLVIG
jgi:hypothetical protein